MTVLAFRAQDFSIADRNLWALEVLAEVGFEIDSSIFPMRTRRYGAGLGPGPAAARASKRRNDPGGAGCDLVGGPLADSGSGGGYFRVLPGRLLDHALREASKTRPAVIYCHPYEFNETELDEYRGRVPPALRYRQGFGRGRFVTRVRRLLTTLEFGRFDTVLGRWGLR